MNDPRPPILVGAGQLTDTTGKPSSERSRVAFSAEAAKAALADAGASIGADALGRNVDALAVMEFFSDISPRFASPYGRSSNPPKSVANRLGAVPRQLLYSHSGGNMPQYLVNRFAEEISRGETDLALVCGAELLRSTQNARRAAMKIDWNEDPGGGDPTRVGDSRFGFSEEEARHELRAAIPPAEETGHMVRLCQSILTAGGYVPYYMYRQKYMAASFANIGYALSGSVSAYNIEMMEERQSVLAAGPGGATKFLGRDGHTLEKVYMPKDVNTYIQALDDKMARRRRLCAIVYGGEDI